MDRNLSKREQEKVRAVRANYFQPHKRKLSATQKPHHEDSTATSISDPQPNAMSTQKRFKFPGISSSAPDKAEPKAPLIVRFYDADIQAKDAHGRTQEHILAWPDSQLERCHNYIQMLFPVPEGSAFNWEAPIIDREVMEQFRSRSELRDRLRRSFERMLDFYGFTFATQTKEDEEQKQINKENINPHVEDPETGATVELNGEASPAAEASRAEASTEDPAMQSTSEPSVPPGAYVILRGPNWRALSRNWVVRFDHNHLRITRILRCLRILGLQVECQAFFAALKEVFQDSNYNISDRSMSYWTRAVQRPLWIAPDDERIAWLKEVEDEWEAAEGNTGEERDTETKVGENKQE